ncbi:MAG: GNAT family N-acetyltransferase [Betaproteobacteria bacterium]|nr:GNAT family N-acetyltransferase [Betaproteobacteria bacterium]
MASPFTVRVLPWSQALPFARPVRLEVFVQEQGVPIDLEWDDWDEKSAHAVAFNAQGEPVGTARLLPDGRIGRMAVLKAWRGQGIGGVLLRSMLEQAAERGMSIVSLHAQTHAAAFYRGHGFSQRGDEFVEAGIPHVEMWRQLG